MVSFPGTRRERAIAFITWRNGGCAVAPGGPARICAERFTGGAVDAWALGWYQISQIV